MANTIVGHWLISAGLERYISNFAGVSEDTFLNLLMQDYGKFGVTDMEDKQKLFRLIKKAGRDPRDGTSGVGNGAGGPYGHAHPSAGGYNSGYGGCEYGSLENSTGLLDLDADDGDLLSEAQGARVQETTNARPEPQPPENPHRSVQDMMSLPVPPKIRVVVRKRPINAKELDKGEDDIIEVDMSLGQLIVNEPKVKVDLQRFTERHRFVFDDALNETVTNDDVYRSTVQPLVQTLFWGGKATCFAYGQTGSGKTYTMTPLPLEAAQDIFRVMALPQYRDVYLFVSCFEIYGGKVFDLLNARKKLEIREDSKRRVCVVGLREYIADSLDYIQQISAHAASARSTGTTGANSDSSRSHAIMQFAVKRGQQGEDGQVLNPKHLGKISFIDLAGSERGADTFDNDRQTRLEGAEINKSLLALKECIRALDSDARHVPFRGSKLTAVLRDSFVGKEARTVMIANVSPNSTSVEHTLNTLRYADRVKELRKEKGERSPSLVTPGSNMPALSNNTTSPAQQQPLAPPPMVPAQARQSMNDTGARPFLHRKSVQPDVGGDPGYGGGGGQYRYDPKGHNVPEPSRMDVYPSNNEVGNGDRDDGYLYGQPNAGGSNNSVEAELLSEHEELMNSILEDEEHLIGHHRSLIEGLMDLVREEMVMLTEVDQPGSAIDKYVERLDDILVEKVEMVQGLSQRLETFKQKLRNEESLSKMIGQRRSRRH